MVCREGRRVGVGGGWDHADACCGWRSSAGKSAFSLPDNLTSMSICAERGMPLRFHCETACLLTPTATAAAR